ncbi:MAG: tetratricopeptide repeat protein [Candidatus Krumholzibacteriota bacterium]|nr:tetratricopeptide repeat protein [Candidatus Krumholzibacteriota bacterium]
MRPIAIALASALLAASCAGPRSPGTAGEYERVVTHEVAPGENWRAIAESFYGDPSRADGLAGFNGQDPRAAPEPGSGVRVPFTGGDLRRLDRRKGAATVYNEGLALADCGDYAGAVERFRKALSLDDSFADASYNLAVTYGRLGLHGEAAGILSDLVRRRPAEARYRFALGNARFHDGNLAGAREAFLAAIERDPGHRQALYALAVACEKLGRNDEAARHLEEYLRLDDEGEWAAEARERLDRLKGRR